MWSAIVVWPHRLGARAWLANFLEKERRSPGQWDLPRLVGTLDGKIVPTKRHGAMERRWYRQPLSLQCADGVGETGVNRVQVGGPGHCCPPNNARTAVARLTRMIAVRTALVVKP
jgi:hypothetical protein